MNRVNCKCFLGVLALFIFSASLLFAQDEHPYHHGVRSSNITPVAGPGIAASTGTSGTGANIDVLYHKIYWRINPDSVKYIKGSVQTNFKTLQSNVSVITFDLRSVLLVDSVIFRNNRLPAGNITRSGNIVSIDIGTTLANNFIDSLVIFYQGVPPATSGQAQGYQKGNTAAAGNFITTLSESYEDRDWWPCKADMQDKIDSLDITVNVPWASASETDTFWVASNGRLVDSTITGINRSFTFKNRYPIASYLVCVCVARYNKYYRTVNINGTDVPVVYNLLIGKTPATYTAILTAMDKINLQLVEFSKKFGDYPFKNEKHGFYDGLLPGGGMEHQTFSGIGSGSLQSVVTLAHELTHQWFGDNVTFSTWNDLWLAEGFASYGEALAGELVPSLGINPYSSRASFKSSALGFTTAGAWIPNSNTSTSQVIWNNPYGSTVYVRGAMIVSMLRSICGDEKFFQATTDYQTSLAGKSATADTLKNYFNKALGRDITPFFTDYVGGSGSSATAVGGVGNPINTVNWNSPAPNKLVVQMAPQSQTAGSNVTYFRGPVVLHIKGAVAAQDTTITFFDWGGGNLSYAGKGLSIPVTGNRLSYYLSFTPQTVAYDDSARTLSTGSALNTPGLDGYTWFGTINTDWNNAGNWSSIGVPPNGADITIATVGSNQPVLPGNITTGPLTINSGNTVIINGNTLTLNNMIRGAGTLTGSPTSNLTVADSSGVLNFNQSSAATRSLGVLTINTGCQATVGTGPVELFGPLNLPKAAKLTVNSSNLIVH